MRDCGEASRFKRALVVAAHPDDAEFGCGGTVALWSRDGWQFHYLILTDGSKGSEDPEMTATRLAAIRQEEQQSAAAVLGVKEVVFLDFVDGELIYGPDVMREVVRHIRRVKPYAVFSSDPNQIVHNNFINHPDHRAAGMISLDAVYPIARNRPSFPELLGDGLEPHSAREVYLWSADAPNFQVDVTEVAELKFQALMQHRSQFAEIDTQVADWRERWSEENGEYVERFRRVELRL